MKPYFSGLARVEFLDEQPDDDLPFFELLEDLSFVLKNESVHVPKGTRGNGASLPRLMRAYRSPIDPKILRASIVHDYLYSGNANGKTRFRCDLIYYMGCRTCGLSVPESFAHFLALRLFGKKRFKRKNAK